MLRIQFISLYQWQMSTTAVSSLFSILNKVQLNGNECHNHNPHSNAHIHFNCQRQLTKSKRIIKTKKSQIV